MINKNLENNLIFSAKKDKGNKMVLVLLKKEIDETISSQGSVLSVGFNENQIEIKATIGITELITYTIPEKDEITKLIKRYDLKYVDLYYADECSEDSEAYKIFSGFLR